MAHYYGDSSALAKRHLPETGTAWLRALIAPETGAVVVTSRISIVEVVSALNRRVREATLNLADYSVLVADFEGLCAAEHGTIELGPTVVTRARVLLERHPLRSHDAIQLSSALMANETLLAAGLPGLVFLCADEQLAGTAQLEGLAAENPNAHA